MGGLAHRHRKAATIFAYRRITAAAITRIRASTCVTSFELGISMRPSSALLR